MLLKLNLFDGLRVPWCNKKVNFSTLLSQAILIARNGVAISNSHKFRHELMVNINWERNAKKTNISQPHSVLNDGICEWIRNCDTIWLHITLNLFLFLPVWNFFNFIFPQRVIHFFSYIHFWYEYRFVRTMCAICIHMWVRSKRTTFHFNGGQNEI